MSNPSPKLVFLAGSARRDSLNKRLARLAAETAAERGATVSAIDLADYPMPLYDGDLEAAEGVPESARALKALFRESAGLFIASPEYNSSLAPLLKNALDWVSRRETAEEPPLVAYKGKVAGLAAASPSGLGGLRGLVALRMMLGNIGVHVIPRQLTVPNAGEAFDADGRLRDAGRREGLEALVDELITTAARLGA